MNSGNGTALTEKQRYWLEHLQVWEKTEGETLRAYAARHGLDIGALYSAKSVLTRKGALTRRIQPPRRFVRAELRPEAPPAALCRVRFPNGVVVEFGCKADAQALRQVLEAVGSL
jgi:hypothetical protein